MSIDKVKEKRLELRAREQAKKDMLSLVYYMNQSKGGQTDLSKEFDRLSSSISNIKLDDEPSKVVAEVVEQCRQAVLLMAAHGQKQSEQLHEALEKLLEASGEKETNITVEGKEIDVTPIVEALSALEMKQTEDKELDLEEYRASDIKQIEDKQYVGFIKPDGCWYIMENDLKTEALRYVFGDTDYLGAFERAGSWQYKLLNEAINEVSS